MTKFKTLLHRCGLSTRSAARMLGLSYDQVRERIRGRVKPAAGEVDKLERYAQAAGEIFGPGELSSDT